MICPYDNKTYTIRMEIDGEVKQWCNRCGVYHTSEKPSVTGASLSLKLCDICEENPCQCNEV